MEFGIGSLESLPNELSLDPDSREAIGVDPRKRDKYSKVQDLLQTLVH